MAEGELGDTEALVRAAQRADREAERALFERFFPVAVRIAEARLGSAIAGDADAEDVAQESFFEALTNLDAFEPRDDASFRDWLARIVENNVRDLARRNTTAKRGGGHERLEIDLGSSSIVAALFPSNEPTPSHVVRSRELEESLRRALACEIGSGYREVVVLRNLCGMSYEQIAARMSYSNPSTVRAMHARALEKLSKYL